MKIAVISDTHCSSLEQLSAAVVDALSGVDLIIHAGDFTSLRVLRDLQKIGEVKAVRGNADFAELRAVLPEKELLVINQRKIAIIHGWGNPWGIEGKIRRQFEDVDVIIYGHTHIPRSELIGDVYFFNPGTARESFGILEIDEDIKGRIMRIESSGNR